MKSFQQTLAALILVTLPLAAFAGDQVSSAKAAERRLLDAAEKYHLAIEDAPGRYYVGGAIDIGAYFVIDLRRTNESLPADWVGSDLAGWFGVRKRDGAIVEWNVADDIPGDPVNPRTQSRPNQPQQHQK